MEGGYGGVGVAVKAVATGAFLVEEGLALQAMCQGWWWGGALAQCTLPLGMAAHPTMRGGVAGL